MSEVAIDGWIELPAPHAFNDAVAVVGLDDVTYVDAPARRVMETVVAPIIGSQARIPFSMRGDVDVSERRRYVLAAVIYGSGERRLQPGDFLTTAAHPWTAGAGHDNVLRVSRI
jgi:uncharacterized lipoprotein YbaY